MTIADLARPAAVVGALWRPNGGAGARERGALLRRRFLSLPLAALLVFAQPAAAQSIPGVDITATISVDPPAVTLWEKHPTAYPGIGISPAYLLPRTTPQDITVSGGRFSFRHYFCVSKQIEEIQPARQDECQIIAQRGTPTSVALTEAMIDHGGVAWHIAVGNRRSLRAQWLPIPGAQTVVFALASESAQTEYVAEIHPNANGLRVTSSGSGAATVRVGTGAVETVASGTTHVIAGLDPGTNALTITVGAATYTATLTRSLFADEALRGAVRQALGKAAGEELEADDLLALRTLNLTGAGVQDLGGLRAATNLDWLSLDGNALRSVAELASLRSLSWLDLSDNAIASLEPLSDLTALRTLYLGGNSVSDLAPLAGLTELEELVLSSNAVSNLRPLSNLAALEQLWLDDNAISDIQPLSALYTLRYLHLGRNGIATVRPLGVLTNLRRLWLNDNAVEDIGPLWRLASLTRLDLRRNRIADISALRHPARLKRLRLGGNRIADIAPLVRNGELAAGDAVELRGNRLSAAAIQDHVPALRDAGAAVLIGWPVSVFPAADDAAGRQGFVRVINHSDAAGEVLVEAVDDAGVRADPVRLAIGARQARHFNSGDLEAGNAAKGLSAGVGAPTAGGWRLALWSALDIEVLAYLRAEDGFLTSVHDQLARDADDVLRAPIFNPGRNRNQASALRLVNPNGAAATVSVWGVDDRGVGRLATGLAVPPGGALTVPATRLEAHRIGDSGRGFGRGSGKWRLRIRDVWPVEAVSLATNASGHMTNLSSSAVDSTDGTVRLPLFPAASNDTRQGFVRLVNRSRRDGVVRITPFDDAGQCPGAVELPLPRSQTVHFNSEDLENGAPDKGLAEGIGPPTMGDWRLELDSELAIDAYAYVRTTDGFLTAMHDAAPVTGGVAHVAFFNPASNERQRSLLRLINNGADPVDAKITGVDDGGEAGGVVRVTVPAGQALTFSAADLESGGAALTGALGDGAGKWRLAVDSDAPLVVMSLLASASGHLTNLSTAPRP